MNVNIVYSIIIPALNEAGTIERALAETVRIFDALQVKFEVIVVDDGSTDATKDRVARVMRKDARIVYIRHECNQGKGGAGVTGARRARGDVFLFLDADLATHPREIYKCIPMLDRSDIVIGSRRIAGSAIIKRQSWFRVIAGRLFNRLVVRWYLGLPYEDTQCGFKVFRKTTSDIFNQLVTRGWVFDAELLARGMKARMRIMEVPVAWHNDEHSRVRIRDFFHILHEARVIRRMLKNKPLFKEF